MSYRVKVGKRPAHTHNIVDSATPTIFIEMTLLDLTSFPRHPTMTDSLHDGMLARNMTLILRHFAFELVLGDWSSA